MSNKKQNFKRLYHISLLLVFIAIVLAHYELYISSIIVVTIAALLSIHQHLSTPDSSFIPENISNLETEEVIERITRSKRQED